MASTTISTANQVTNFQKKVFNEYIRGGKFGPYIGASENALIQINKDLKKRSIPLIAKLKKAGVRGSALLTGNEEALSDYAMPFQPTHMRHGVLIDNEEREKSEFDLFSEAKPSLMNWTMEKKRDLIIQSLLAIEAGGTYYNYGGGEATGATGSSAASAANMDTWTTNNSDRILYGASKSNLTAGDHTTSLGTIDTTNDKLTTNALTLLKRIAGSADPLIRPIQINNDEPFYVYFVGQYGFRDLQADSVMIQANREARERGKSNPLFKGGDLMWDNILIKEIPDMDRFIDGTGTNEFDGIWGANASGDSLATSGDTSSRVGVGFLCGAQSVIFGRGKDAQFSTRKEDDYGHLNGVATSMKHDIKKAYFNNKQHGIVTHFHSAAVDA